MPISVIQRTRAIVPSHSQSANACSSLHGGELTCKVRLESCENTLIAHNIDLGSRAHKVGSEFPLLFGFSGRVSNQQDRTFGLDQLIYSDIVTHSINVILEVRQIHIA